MDNASSFFTRRKILAIAVCLLIGSVALTVMLDSSRDKAIAAAKQYGKIFVLRGQVYSVTLSNRKAVDQVLPLLDHVSELRELVIYGVDLTPDDIRAISQLTSLLALRLDGCGLRGAELDPLGNLTNVTELHLIKNPLTDRGMQFMSSMTKLEKVDLCFTTIHGEGIKYLTNAPALRQLLLTKTLVDDTSIGQCAALSRLEFLSFPETAVTAAGLMQLVNMHWLTHLGFPDDISNEDAQAFLDAFLKSRREASDSGRAVPTHNRMPFVIPT